MISGVYDVDLYFYSINEEYGQKITITKITPGSGEGSFYRRRKP